MLCIPKPNHKKLVDDCYPTPKALPATAPEYQPNSNELSRLCYYAQNKPAKLAKVGRLLAVRTRTEAGAMRTVPNERVKAGMMLTLAILKELVGTSPEGLTYLAPYARTVLCSALEAAAPTSSRSTWDAEIAARAASTFALYARSLPTGSLDVDDAVAQSITQVLQCLVPMASAGVKAGQDDERARLICLGGFDGVVRSHVLFSPAFASLLQRVLPVLLETLYPTHVPLEEARSIAAESGAAAVPTPSTEETTAAVTTAAACAELQALVQRADVMQLRAVIDQVLAWLDAPTTEGRGARWTHDEWSVWFFTLITRWAPSSSRYIVPHALNESLETSSTSSATTLRNTRILQALHLIFADGIDIVGLNMAAILDGHVTFLLANTAQNPDDPIVGATIDAVGHLAAHSQYAAQLRDIVKQLNAHIVALISGTAGYESYAPDERDNAVRALLYCQMSIFRIAGATPSVQSAMANVPLSAWQSTEHVLLSRNSAVRFTYLQALMVYLDRERVRKMAPGDAAFAAQSDASPFLNGFTADAYTVLSRSIAAPTDEAPLEYITLGDSEIDVSLLESVPADYVAYLAVLEQLYEVFPASSLLATVPALLALDRQATTQAPASSALVQERRSACRWVVGLALAKLAQVWDVPPLLSYVQEHVLRHVRDLQMAAPSLPAQFGAAPALATFGGGAASTATLAVADAETVAELLASSSPLQTATGAHAQALRSWLLRSWTVSLAIQEAQTSAQPLPKSPSSPVVVAAGQTTQAPSLSREGSVSVNQLRMALMNRQSMRSGVPASVAENAGASDASPMSPRARRLSRGADVSSLSNRTSVSNLLDKYISGSDVAPGQDARVALGPGSVEGPPVATVAAPLSS
ncbi:plasma membrane localization protein [Malassezia sp. CBS 17886]|nr:plasma membrane localization protein [Malassezia sp. CBS 17886]